MFWMPRSVMASLSRTIEFIAQWDRILAAGPLYLVTLSDLGAVRSLGIGDFYQVVSGVHHRLSDFIHAVVVHRRLAKARFYLGQFYLGQVRRRPNFFFKSGSPEV